MTKRQIMEKIPFKLLAVFLLLASGVCAGGFVFYKQQRARSVAHIQEDLNTIAQLKSEEITAWRRERYGDAFVITRSQQFAASVRRWYGNPGDKKLKDYIYKRLDAFRIYETYKDVILVGPNGKARMFIDQGGSENISQATLNIVREAERHGRIIFSDFYYCSKCREVHLDVAAPLHDGEINAGAIILRINPDKYLYPLIQRWPDVSKSGETVLIRREGEDVVYLNELRHKKGAAMHLRLPLSDVTLPAAMAARGKEGMVEGNDYRGVQVVASVKRIAESPWYMVTKMDKEEIYAPLRRQAVGILFMVILTIILLAAVLSFIWQADRRGFYKKQYQLELDKQVLIKHYDYLTKYANDIILLSDERYNLIEVNDRACQVYGYNREELLKMNALALRADETKPQFKGQIEKMIRQGGMVYETVHKRKDGSTFPVESSARPIEIEGKNYLQGIVRDITERKQYELKLQDRNEELEAANQELVAAEEDLRHQMEELQRSKEEIANEKSWSDTLIQSAPNIVIGLGEKSEILLFNSYAEKLTGYQASEVLGKNWIDIFIPEEQRPQLYGIWDEITKNKYIEHYYENPVITKKNEIRVISWSNSFLTEKGQFKMVLSLGQDITEKKLAEEKLRLKNLTFDASIAANSIADDKGIITEANHSFLRLWGFQTNEEVVGKPILHFLQNEEEAKAVITALNNSGKWEGEYTAKRKDGTTFIAYGLATDIRDEENKLIGYQSAVLDITEQKRAEEELKKTQELLKNAYRLAHIGAWSWAAETDTVNWTEELYRIAGRDPKMPAPAYAEHPTLYTPESWDRLKSSVDKVMATGAEYQLELELIRPDGTTRWINAFGGATKNGQGNIIGLFGTVQDITERKQAEEKIKAQLAELQTMYEAMLGREDRVREVKKEVNDLLREIGRPEKYME